MTVKKMWIRPAMVDAGRGPERARIPYQRGGVWRELAEGGEQVPTKGREGAMWRRRLADGGVERFDPDPKPKAEPGETPKAEPPATTEVN